VSIFIKHLLNQIVDVVYRIGKRRWMYDWIEGFL
jgi:hypothetical protein